MLPHRPDTSETLQFCSIRSFTEALASYTHARFEEERVKQLSAKNQTSATTESSHIQDMDCAVIPPIKLSIPMVAECDWLAEMLATAFLDPGEPRLSVVMSTSPSRSMLKYVSLGTAPGFNCGLSGPHQRMNFTRSILQYQHWQQHTNVLWLCRMSMDGFYYGICWMCCQRADR